ncbi:MAG: NfeD family protein [Acidimicrobiales bacterium]
MLVALTLASALLVIEAALPTVGLAGLSGLSLLLVALLAAARGSDPWWPLILVGAAVCVWTFGLLTRSSSVNLQAVAMVCFALGSVSYGILAADVPTVALAVAGSVALPLGYWPLLAASNRLMSAPAQTGMEALVGRAGTVSSWSKGRGSVRVDGSLWNARSRSALEPGAEVVVTGHREMWVDVDPAPDGQWG